MVNRSAARGVWWRIGLAALFGGVLVAFFALGGPGYLSLETIKQNRDALLAFVDRHYAAAVVLASLGYVAAAAFSLPGGLVLSLTMGFLFGRWVGTVLITLSATVGATLLFLAARYLFADVARRRMGPLGERINEGFTRNGFHYLLFLRLVPLFPFFLVNLAPAFTSISTRTFVLATLIGIVPGTFIFANLGQTLGRIETTSELISPQTLGALALLGAFSLLPLAVARWRARHPAPSRGRALHGGARQRRGS